MTSGKPRMFPRPLIGFGMILSLLVACNMPSPVADRAGIDAQPTAAREGNFRPRKIQESDPSVRPLQAVPDPDAPRMRIPPKFDPPRHQIVQGPQRSKKHTGGPQAGDGDWGVRLNPVSSDNTQNIGIYAGQKIRTNLELPHTWYWGGLWLYAPTVVPPNRTPLESSTRYFRYPWDASTHREWGVWNFSTNSWVLSEWVDQTFLDKYVRSDGGEPTYWTEVIRQSGSTTVYLFNFLTGAWQPKYSTTGQGARDDGWCVFETWYADQATSCLSLNSSSGGYDYIRSKALRLNKFDGSGWPLVTGSMGTQLTSNTSNCINSKNKVWLSQWFDWYVDNGP